MYAVQGSNPTKCCMPQEIFIFVFCFLFNTTNTKLLNAGMELSMKREKHSVCA